MFVPETTGRLLEQAAKDADVQELPRDGRDDSGVRKTSEGFLILKKHE